MLSRHLASLWLLCLSSLCLPGCSTPEKANQTNWKDASVSLKSIQPPEKKQGLFSGINLGSMAHDAGLTGETYEGGTDTNAEILFAQIPQTIDILGTPQPHLGLTINNAGATSQAYTGLTWTVPITKTMFSNISLGGAAHNGQLATRRIDQKGLGSRLLFRVALELGFRLSENHHISIIIDHVSNAGLADINEGLDTIGIRFGYTF